MPEQQPLGTTYNTNHGLSPSAKLKTNSSHPQGLKGNLNLLHLYNIYIQMYYLFVYLFKKNIMIHMYIYTYITYIYIHVKNARIWWIPNYVIFRGERHQRWSLDAPKNIQCHRIKWVPLGLGFPNQKDVIYKYTLPETNSKFAPVRKPGTPKGGSPSSSKFIPFLGGKTRC